MIRQLFRICKIILVQRIAYTVQIFTQTGKILVKAYLA